MATTERGTIEELRWENQVAFDSLLTQTMQGPAGDPARWIQCYPLSCLGATAVGGAAIGRVIDQVLVGNGTLIPRSKTPDIEAASRQNRRSLFSSAASTIGMFGLRTLVSAITSQVTAEEALRSKGIDRTEIARPQSFDAASSMKETDVV